jgi:hypothetical protein
MSLRGLRGRPTSVTGVLEESVGKDEPRFRSMLSVLRRKSTAGCVGRSPGLEVQTVICYRFTFPGQRPSGVRSGVLTYSGGTAPDLHRTSLLCPSRAPKQDLRYTTTSTTPANVRPFLTNNSETLQDFGASPSDRLPWRPTSNREARVSVN